MPLSECDQKKEEIVRLVEQECRAENDTAEAIYDLECLEVKEKYKSQKEQACRDLLEQESKELAEMKRHFDAKMKPIKVKHEEKLSEVRYKYRIAGLETGPLPSAGLEASNSPDPAMAARLADQQKAEAGRENSAACVRHIDDSEESGDETDNSIPARPSAPQAATKATTEARFAPFQKRKRLPSAELQLDEDYEPDFSQNEDNGEQDDVSDGTYQNSPMQLSGKVTKASKRAPAQRLARHNASSASPKTMENGHHRKVLNNGFGTRNSAHQSTRSSQAGVGDGDESVYSGSASQGPRRGARHGRPQPGKYRMNANAWPV